MSPFRFLAVGLAVAIPAGAQQRPMTFLDPQHLRTVGSPAVSPDGRQLLYTLSVPDWKEARRQTDIYLVSLDGGVATTRQMTFTGDKSETSPTWAPDGSFFVFSSNRDGTGASPSNQLFLMRTDGGEARRITDARDGVAAFAFTRDGRWLVYTAGRAEDRQLWALPLAGLDTAAPRQLTRGPTPVRSFLLAPDGGRVYYTAPDTVDRDAQLRRERRYTVNIRNEEQPPDHLWALELESLHATRLTSGDAWSVSGVTVSRDGRWIGFRGTDNNRYRRSVTESNIYADVFLLETATGRIERLTDNEEVGESTVSFSPDGSMLAIAAPNDWTYFRDTKLWVRPTAPAGAPWRKLGARYDGTLSTGFWSADGGTIYFNDGVRATTQVAAVSVATGEVQHLTAVRGTVSADPDEATGVILLTYQDPGTPADLYAVRGPEDIGNRSAWVRLTDANPWLRDIALGEVEELSWRSRDGRTVGGILVKPLDWQPGRRYPLVVQIHGGPASAYVLSFNPGTNAQAYAGAGYAVLLPNYRGSTNYGERHRLDIVGDYFRKGYEDIMTGVDHVIRLGIAAPDSLGAMGWSAGGHWSNWIMTRTDRFKAISSGAGAVNWISMYAQSDVQRNRAEYFGRGAPPYADFDAYWRVSPLRYIRNAKTPTLIHVVDGDPRVPRPQSEELHMALRQLGVPTEFFVYPGSTHGIPDPRNQYLKALAEFRWFEHWIRGEPWFTWRELIEAVDEPPSARRTAAAQP